MAGATGVLEDCGPREQLVNSVSAAQRQMNHTGGAHLWVLRSWWAAGRPMPLLSPVCCMEDSGHAGLARGSFSKFALGAGQWKTAFSAERTPNRPDIQLDPHSSSIDRSGGVARPLF
jgi:hypothetical protein